MSVFDRYNSTFFSAQIGDTCTVTYSGSLHTFYGILKQQELEGFDDNRRAFLFSETMLTVSASVLRMVQTDTSISVNNTVWNVSDHRVHSNGQTVILTLTKV